MIREALFLLLPVLCAGVTFIVYLRMFNVPILNIPLDGCKTFRGKRILGENKTIKGPLFMIIGTVFYGYIVYVVLGSKIELYIGWYEALFRFSLVGLAYSLGEIPTSFIKRQLGIPPGISPSWQYRVLDICDSVLAVGIMAFFVIPIQNDSIVLAVLMGVGAHMLTDQLMKTLHLKK